MVLFFVAIAASSWYFEIFAEKFLDNIAKAKRQNKILDHSIKLSLLPHQYNSEDIPEHQPPLCSPSCSLCPPWQGHSRNPHASLFLVTLPKIPPSCKSCLPPALPHLAPASWGALAMGKTEPSIPSCTGTWLHGPGRQCQDQAFKDLNVCFILMQPPFTSTAKPLRHRLQAHWETTNTLWKLAATSILSRQSGGRLLPKREFGGGFGVDGSVHHQKLEEWWENAAQAKLE